MVSCKWVPTRHNATFRVCKRQLTLHVNCWKKTLVVHMYIYKNTVVHMYIKLSSCLNDCSWTYLFKLMHMDKRERKYIFIYIIDHQSWNSSCKVASDQEFTFSSAIEPTKEKHNALWPSQKHGASVVPIHWSTHLSCADPRLGFCWKIMAGLSVAW